MMTSRREIAFPGSRGPAQKFVLAVQEGSSVCHILPEGGPRGSARSRCGIVPQNGWFRIWERELSLAEQPIAACRACWVAALADPRGDPPPRPWRPEP